MYKPCQPRPKKTNIVRTRSGCQECRKSKHKCDETRPHCLRCQRRGRTCSGYARTLSFVNVSESTARASMIVEAAKWASIQEEDELSRNRGSSQSISNSHQHTNDHENSDTTWHQDIYSLNRPRTAASTPTSNSSPDIVLSSREPSSQDLYGQRNGDHAILDYPLSPWSISLSSNDVSDFTSISEIPHSMDRIPFDDNFNHISSNQGVASNFPHHSSLLSIDTPLSPPTSFLSGIEIYLHHFDNHLSKTLPIAITARTRYIVNPCFRDALCALSAANLSRVQSRGFSPSAIHREKGSRYYMAAAKGLRKQLSQGDEFLEHNAASAILLTYCELENGTPRGARLHLEGLSHINDRIEEDHAVSDQELRKAEELLKIYSGHQVNALREVGPFDNLSTIEKPDLRTDIEKLALQLTKLYYRYAMESSCIVDGQSSTNLSKSQQIGVHLAVEFGQAYRSIGLHKADLNSSDVQMVCSAAEHQLDAWHSRLTMDHLPMIKFDAYSTGNSSSSISIKPLLFRTYSAASDYLCYALSRLLVTALEWDMTTHLSPTHSPELKHWTEVALGACSGTFAEDANISSMFNNMKFQNALVVISHVFPSRHIWDYIETKIIKSFSSLTASALRADTLPFPYVPLFLEFLRQQEQEGREIRCTQSNWEEGMTDPDRRQSILDGSFKIGVFGYQIDCNERVPFMDFVTLPPIE